MRSLSYVEAINETLHQMIDRDKRVFLIGQGVNSPWYAGNSTIGLLKRFGPDRIWDTPISENAVTGAAVGAALTGMRPIVFHARMDFMLYAMDQIVNSAANWHYMFGNRVSVPITIWGIINRGGEQGAQHSQALQAIFAHMPGLKVVMPSTPYDAKGLLVASIEDNNPVIFIDDRWLYNIIGEVPEELYSIPIGKGIIRSRGSDITIVASSFMVHEALTAVKTLEEEGIHAELIDMRSVKPLDKDLLMHSIEKTRRLVIADGGWKTYGIAAEISASVAENYIFKQLAVPIRRICLPDTPAPACAKLEKQYYRSADHIISEVKRIMA